MHRTTRGHLPGHRAQVHDEQKRRVMNGPRRAQGELTIGIVGPHDLVERIMLSGTSATAKAGLAGPLAAAEAGPARRLVAAAYRDEQEAADQVVRLGTGIDVCLFASRAPYEYARMAGVLSGPATYVPLGGSALYATLLKATRTGPGQGSHPVQHRRAEPRGRRGGLRRTRPSLRRACTCARIPAARRWWPRFTSACSAGMRHRSRSPACSRWRPAVRRGRPGVHAAAHRQRYPGGAAHRGAARRLPQAGGRAAGAGPRGGARPAGRRAAHHPPAVTGRAAAHRAQVPGPGGAAHSRRGQPHRRPRVPGRRHPRLPGPGDRRLPGPALCRACPQRPRPHHRGRYRHGPHGGGGRSARTRGAWAAGRP